MGKRQGVILYLVALGILVITALLTPEPGYMDADYYFAGGINFQNGNFGQEEYIWNFLGNPPALPTPAFTYWMPLPAFLAGLGMFLSGSSSYWLARLPFIALAASLAPLTAWLAYSFSNRSRDAWMAGLLAAVSGYYLPYLTSTSTFTPVMLLGTLFVVLGARLFQRTDTRRRFLEIFLLGITCGLLHMNRADGLVWFGLAFIVLVIIFLREKVGFGSFVTGIVLLSVGYILISGAWYLRNLREFDSLFPPGTNRSLWLTYYDELFALDTSILTPARWMASGFQSIVGSRLQAAGQNLLHAFAVQGEIILTPFILLGVWKLWKTARVKIVAFIWLVTFLLMSMVFPFAGMRGGFFHSGAMIQPFFFALVPAGLDAVIQWGKNKRGWTKPVQAWNVFAAALIVLSFGITAAVTSSKVSHNPKLPYEKAGELMKEFEIPTQGHHSG